MHIGMHEMEIGLKLHVIETDFKDEYKTLKKKSHIFYVKNIEWKFLKN